MTPLPCTIDAARLLAYLDDPNAAPDLPAHVQECRRCQTRLLAIAGAARVHGNDRSDMRQTQDDILALIDTEAAGVEPGDDLLPIQLHLLACSDCFALYKDLSAMNELILTDALPTPPAQAYRPPDLSFLRQPVERLVSYVRQQGETWLRTLQINLSLVFQPLQPAPALSQREGKAAAEDQTVRQITFGAQELEALDVTVRLTPSAHTPDLARIEVQALSSDRLDLDFSGTRVILRLEDGREAMQETDLNGWATFDFFPETLLRTATLEITTAHAIRPQE